MNILESKQSIWLEELIQSSHIGILVVNKDRKNLFVNQRICEMFGYSNKELLGSSAEILHVNHESYLRFAKLAFDFVLKGRPVGIDYQFKRKDGSLFWIHIAGDVVEGKEEVLWTMVDITKNIESEHKITQLKDRMELSLKGSLSAIWDFDIESNLGYISPRWKEMLGYENDSKTIYKFKEWLRFVHPNDIAKVMINIDDHLSGKIKYINTLHRERHKEGSWVWINSSGQVTFNKSGKAVRISGTFVDVTKEKVLELKNSRQAKIIEQIHDCVIETDMDGFITSWNYGSEVLLSYTAQEMLGKHITQIYLKEDIDSLLKSIDILKKDGKYSTEVRLVKKNRDIIFVELNLALLEDEDGNVTGMIGFAKDITKRKMIEKNLETANYNMQQYLDAIDKIKIGLFVVNEDFSVRYMNKTMIKWFGNQTGRNCYKSVANLVDPCPYCKLSEVINDNQEVSYQPTAPNGQAFDIVATPIKNVDGTNSKMEIIRDITDSKTAERVLLEQKQKLDHQAHHDSLTGLPNRLLFSDRLEQSIEKNKRKNTKMALLFIDLDHFKEINDSLGHSIGDLVLKDVTKSLQSVIRSEDTLARLGGDEFTIIVNEIYNIQDVSTLAQKIIKVLSSPVNINEQELYVSSSIGISLYPDDGTDAQNLLKYADAAMYKAKAEGRNNFQFYSSEMTELAFERIVMEASLRTALKNEDFVVYFQPQIDGITDKLIGMEALVRWNHLTMGIVSPDKFIPLAESTGFIVKLDRFVMKTAMTQVAKWYKQGLNPGVLALNLSVKQLVQSDFLEVLKNMMEETSFKSEWLELELTESQIMGKPEESIKILNNISDLGISLAIDDFGTGYSSLAYLKKLPIDKLKIDQSFIREVPKDEEDSAIVKAVIALSQSLKLNVIAEGVETKEQRDFIVENGCKNIQGYFYSKPVDSKRMNDILLQDKVI